MDAPGTPPGCERIAYVLVHREHAAFSDTYGGGGNVVGLDCHLVRPIGAPPTRVLVFTHPTGGGMYLPIVSGLAAAGHHVIWANSRYRCACWRRSPTTTSGCTRSRARRTTTPAPTGGAISVRRST